jgi:DNA-directed RNA polymerase specialized sigma24 family protein
MAKLTDDTVRAIRRRYLDGESQQQIADSLGVTQVTVSLVLRRKTWAHVV